MFRTLQQIKDANKATGLYWFEPESMRFFKSRVSEKVYPTKDGGAYFVSSERGPSNVRAYTIRKCRADGYIRTAPCGFQAHKTRRIAHKCAAELRACFDAE